MKLYQVMTNSKSKPRKDYYYYHETNEKTINLFLDDVHAYFHLSWTCRRILTPHLGDQ